MSEPTMSTAEALGIARQGANHYRAFKRLEAMLEAAERIEREAEAAAKQSAALLAERDELKAAAEAARSAHAEQLETMKAEAQKIADELKASGTAAREALEQELDTLRGLKRDLQTGVKNARTVYDETIAALQTEVSQLEAKRAELIQGLEQLGQKLSNAMQPVV